MSMKKMKKATMAAMILLGCVCAPVAATVSYAQLTDAAGNKVESDTSKQTTKSGGGFYDIVSSLYSKPHTSHKNLLLISFFSNTLSILYLDLMTKSV